MLRIKTTTADLNEIQQACHFFHRTNSIHHNQQQRLAKKFLLFMTLFTKSTQQDPAINGLKLFTSLQTWRQGLKNQVLRCGFNTPLSGTQNWFWAHPASYEAPGILRDVSFHREVDKNRTLLSYYAPSRSDFLLTFRDSAQ
jgi:hypothetical protein